MSKEHPHANQANDAAPDVAIERPTTFGPFDLDEAVIESFPVPGTEVVESNAYGRSLWGNCAQVVTKLPDGTKHIYFLKVASGPMARTMCEGEYEAMKALYHVSPSMVPRPWVSGKYKNQDSYFMLTDYREVGEQPASALTLPEQLAELHMKSKSPTGKFGFHTTTCHGFVTQLTDIWEESWAVLYRKQLSHMFDQLFAQDRKRGYSNIEFEKLAELTLNKVTPRLLEPLQNEGRNIKPCLLHGDCWDENTATDAETGQPFIFDAGSFYGHNEYEIGNWRAPRHRLSKAPYTKKYLEVFEPSKPAEDWNYRNILYSLRFNLGTELLIPGCNQREVVFNDMKELCSELFPEEFHKIIHSGRSEKREGEKEGKEE